MKRLINEEGLVTSLKPLSKQEQKLKSYRDLYITHKGNKNSQIKKLALETYAKKAKSAKAFLAFMTGKKGGDLCI